MSFVYFIRELPNGPIKIGRSEWPWRRLVKLQTGNPRRLEFMVVGEVGNAKAEEHRLHVELKRFRIPGGEWFEPDQAVFEAASRFKQTRCRSCQGTKSLTVTYGYDSKVPIVTCVPCGGVP